MTGLRRKCPGPFGVIRGFIMLALALYPSLALSAQVQGVADQVLAGLQDIRTEVINSRTYGAGNDPATTAALMRVQNEVDADRVVIDRLLAQITGNTGEAADSVSRLAMRRLAERADDAHNSAAVAQAQAENLLAAALALVMSKNGNQESLDAVKRRVAVLTRIRDLELLRETNLRDLAGAIAPVQ